MNFDVLFYLSNILYGNAVYSNEIRGEILFVLYKLSILNATPWDDICANGDMDLSATGKSLLQLSLEVLLKTQNDAVRVNCVGQYISFFDIVNGVQEIILVVNMNNGV